MSPRPPQAPRIVTVEEGGIDPALLEALVIRVRLRKLEWYVVVGLLVNGAPLTARQLARWLGLDYATTKRTVRELLAWNLLERAPVGVRFQPDASRWGPTATREPGS